MARNTLSDPREVLNKFVAKGLADKIIRPPNKKGLFAFSKANRYYVGKLDPKSRNSVRVREKFYTSRQEALEQVPRYPIPSNLPEDVAAIMRFCDAGEARVASHLHGEYFVVTRQIGTGKAKDDNGERRWFTARVHKGEVKVDNTALDSRGAAVVRVEKKGGDHPTKSLQNVPSYPLQLYFTG